VFLSGFEVDAALKKLKWFWSGVWRPREALESRPTGFADILE